MGTDFIAGFAKHANKDKNNIETEKAEKQNNDDADKARSSLFLAGVGCSQNYRHAAFFSDLCASASICGLFLQYRLRAVGKKFRRIRHQDLFE